jgi:hypothetical protein
VFGGPGKFIIPYLHVPLLIWMSKGIGDLRSKSTQTTSWKTTSPYPYHILNPYPSHQTGRLVRLIPDNGDPHSEAASIKALFNHRLPPNPKEARLEWLEIVESLHPLWHQISTPKKELIRSFLNLVNQEIVKRMRPSSRFDFSSASIGNLFLTG